MNLQELRRSAVLRKNRALNLEAFHYYLGQNKLDN
jgi:hypothetical protein